VLEKDGLIYETITDVNGFYKLPGVSKGVYKVKIQLNNYIPAVLESVLVEESKTILLIQSLQPGLKKSAFPRYVYNEKVVA
jgi:hypothetical protein